MALQAAEGHVLVHEQPLVPLRAEPDQANKILMIQHCKHEHLYQELVTALHTILSKLLHRHHLRVREEQQATKIRSLITGHYEEKKNRFLQLTCPLILPL
jgi:hypothetical protein